MDFMNQSGIGGLLELTDNNFIQDIIVTGTDSI